MYLRTRYKKYTAPEQRSGAVVLYEALFFGFRVAVDAAVNAALAVCKPEHMLELLFRGGDAPGIFAADDAGDRLWKGGMNFLHPLAVPDDVHGDLRRDAAQHVVVEVDDLVHFQNIFPAVFRAGGVFDERHLAFKVVELQIMVKLHAPPGGDVVDDDAVYNAADNHIDGHSFQSSMPSNAMMSAMRIYLPFRTCLK